MVTRGPPAAGLAAAAGALVAAAAGAVVGFAAAVVGAAAGAVVGAAAGAVVGAAAGGAAPPLQAARIADPGMLPSTSAAPCSIWRRDMRRVPSLLIRRAPPDPVTTSATVRGRFCS